MLLENSHFISYYRYFKIDNDLTITNMTMCVTFFFFWILLLPFLQDNIHIQIHPYLKVFYADEVFLLLVKVNFYTLSSGSHD